MKIRRLTMMVVPQLTGFGIQKILRQRIIPEWFDGLNCIYGQKEAVQVFTIQRILALRGHL